MGSEQSIGGSNVQGLPSLQEMNKSDLRLPSKLGFYFTFVPYIMFVVLFNIRLDNKASRPKRNTIHSIIKLLSNEHRKYRFETIHPVSVMWYNSGH